MYSILYAFIPEDLAYGLHTAIANALRKNCKSSKSRHPIHIFNTSELNAINEMDESSLKGTHRSTDGKKWKIFENHENYCDSDAMIQHNKTWARSAPFEVNHLCA